jgi:hypothetical protein
MTARRTPLTLDEHRQVGLALAAMRDEMMRIGTWLANEHLPKNHPAVWALRSAGGRADDARTALLNAACVTSSLAHIHSADLDRLYYPDPEDRAAWPSRRTLSPCTPAKCSAATRCG